MADRLRVVLEFKKTNIEELELYSKLLSFSNPASTVKDILKKKVPLSVLEEDDINEWNS